MSGRVEMVVGQSVDDWCIEFWIVPDGGRHFDIRSTYVVIRSNSEAIWTVTNSKTAYCSRIQYWYVLLYRNYIQ
jgi:hypothetical protein